MRQSSEVAITGMVIKARVQVALNKAVAGVMAVIADPIVAARVSRVCHGNAIVTTSMLNKASHVDATMVANALMTIAAETQGENSMAVFWYLLP